MVAKRFMDIVISLFSLVLLSPVFLAVAAASKLISPGERLMFRQKRYGRNAVVFNLVKFQTLDSSGKPLSRFHSFLRQTGLDELPQLIHILSGTMSLVGPRPLDIKEREIHHMREQAGIYSLRPGLTGWAQINGGADLSDEDKTERDIEYLRRRSFGSDLLIIIETGLQMFSKRNPSAPGKLHVFMTGSKGIPASYGGFETLVDNLVRRKQDVNISYHVYGMGENKPVEINGAECRYFPSKLSGAAGRMGCAARQLISVLWWKVRHPLERTVVLILGSRAGVFLYALSPVFHSLGINIIGHPDGFEEKRAKWGWLQSRIVRASQKGLLSRSDHLIFDSLAVKETYHPETPGTYIPYGGENVSGSKNEYRKWLRDNRLEKGRYYLMVSRAVPENNHNLAIEALGNGQIPLVILSGDPEYFRGRKGRNTLILDSVYEPALLSRVREGSLALIHAHEAGGSNPGLIEALAQNVFILALDTPCNREVAGNGAVWFTKDAGSLAEAAEKAQDSQTRAATLEAARKRAGKFGWKEIVSAYERVFKELGQRADSGL